MSTFLPLVLLAILPAPWPVAPEDPLAEFLAHYATIDRKISNFRAVIEVVHRFPKASGSQDPSVLKVRPPLGAEQELRPWGIVNIVYSKNRRSIWKQHIGEGITSLPSVRLLPVHKWHAYDGTRHLAMDLVLRTKTDWGNERTEWILDAREAPLFWYSGILIMDPLCFHREQPRPEWSHLGQDAEGHHRFYCVAGNNANYVLTTSSAPSWRILRCEFVVRGETKQSTEILSWSSTAEGTEYPTAWTHSFTSNDPINNVTMSRVLKSIVNKELDPAVFTPDFSANFQERRYRNGAFRVIEPLRWQTWHLTLMGVAFFSALISYLIVRFWRRSMRHPSAASVGSAKDPTQRV